MKQEDIDTFLAVVQSGSITKAAGETFISQTAASQRIKSLERELNVRLIERGKGQRDVSITEMGRQFIEIAEQITALEKKARNLASLLPTTELTVGAGHSLTTCILSDTCFKFTEEQRVRKERLNLSVKSFSSREAYQQVDLGEVDIAFVANAHYHQNVLRTPLFKEKMVLLCKKGIHEVVSPVDLDPQKEILLKWNLDFQLWHDYWFGVSSNPVVTTDNIRLIGSAMRNGDYWAYAPASVADYLLEHEDSLICKAQMSDAPPDRITYMLTKSAILSDNIVMFVNTLKKDVLRRPGMELL